LQSEQTKNNIHSLKQYSSVRKKAVNFFFFLLTIISFEACLETSYKSHRLSNDSMDIDINDSLKKITSVFNSEDSNKIFIHDFLKNSIPIMGYRFVISGDFDGDNVQDTLYERYTDSLFLKEAPKYYCSTDSSINYFQIIYVNDYLKRKSFLFWNKMGVKLEGGALGFHYIETCGDINVDGKDEIVVVKQYDDQSNCNSAYFYTYKNKQWEEIYSTPVWEWQFPTTPNASMLPGIYGNSEIGVVEKDSTNLLIEKQLKEFRFVTYHADKSVEFNGSNPIDIFTDKNLEKEFDVMAQELFVKKYFDIVLLKNTMYLRSKTNSSTMLSSVDAKSTSDKNDPGFIYDFSGMISTRIYIVHPKSPFRSNIKIVHYVK